MKLNPSWAIHFFTGILITGAFLQAHEKELPQEMQNIMHQPKYAHSIWGLYVKDLETGKVLFDLNSEKLFSPASTTKLFSVAALLHTFGDDYRFKTPIFALGTMKNGTLEGKLILVAQGDLTMGGRQPDSDTIDFTKMDHIMANEVPGVNLTEEDPLQGMNALAKQVYENGIQEVIGDVQIDDSLFETTEKRGMVVSPIMINENLIDIVINPSSVGQKADVTWRPQVPGYTVENQVKTVAEKEPLALEIKADASGHHIVVLGTVPMGQQDIVRTSSILDPKVFARAALIQALQKQGVKLQIPSEAPAETKPLTADQNSKQVALWTSPPLSEYGKLILKVSHNLGANLVPLLLASRQGQKTFDQGMRLLGDFTMQEIKLSPDTFVFIDGAGGNENRLTPQAEVELLTWVHKQNLPQFQRYFEALPILGVDGSLEDFAKKTEAVGKVRAKPGTGVSFNLATEKYFLITQALAGYIQGKNGHLFAYMLGVNNSKMPTIEDIFPIFEDVSQLSNQIYLRTQVNPAGLNDTNK